MTSHKIEKRDAWWLLAYPVYQLIGTVRHEGSHALAVLLEGGRVLKFVFWPTWQDKFYFGYVRWAGRGLDWKVSFAPYFVDLLTFALFYLLCTRVPIKRHWLWVNLYVIGLVSPLVDSLYRYVSSFFREGDLASVYAALPDPAVHAYFVGTTVIYVVSLWSVQKGAHGFDDFMKTVESFVTARSDMPESGKGRNDGQEKGDEDGWNR